MNGALARLTERWRRDAERFCEYGDERGARTCKLHAKELEAALSEHDHEALTITESSDVSGYSESHGSSRSYSRRHHRGSAPRRGRQALPLRCRGWGCCGDGERVVGPFHPLLER